MNGTNLIFLFFFHFLRSTLSFTSNPADPIVFTSSQPLDRFVFSPETRTFFIGGTNILLEVNATNLHEIDKVVTGPKFDSPSCHASGCSDPDKPKKLTNNVNKVLVLDQENENLIVCGSLFQGSCFKHNLKHLDQSEFIPEPVAANNNFSSTYAFIGPQKYNRWGHGNVLYVGTTFTHEGDYRHDVPAISSRNLQDLKFAEYSFSKQSLLRIDVKFRDSFLVQYKYGFSTDTHVYFITVQKKSHIAGQEDKGYVTRLARACITDPNFDTYSEVTLECFSGRGDVRNILQAAEFSSSDSNFLSKSLDYRSQESVLVGAFTDQKGKHSSICTYPLTQIETLFNENIHNCFNGSMQNRNLDYVSGPIHEGRCPSVGNGANIDDWCQVGLKISGKFPISANSTYDLGGKVSSVALDNVVPVIFVGTESGIVSGIHVADPQHVEVFEERNFREPIKQLEVLGDILYYLTDHKFGQTKVANCQKYLNCKQCSKARNPYCVWCPTLNECVDLQLCKMSNNWNVNNQECVQVVKVHPEVLALNSPYEDVYFYMTGLPKNNQTFICRYDESDAFAFARPFDGGLVCPNPLTKLSPISIRTKVNVSLSYELAISPIIVTTLDVMDCSRASNCQDCASLSSSCRWCFTSNTCQHKNENFCKSSSDSCPTIQKKNILVPNDMPSSIGLSFNFLPREYANANDVYCMVDLEGAKMKIPAKISNSFTVLCEETRYKYISDQAELEVDVKVIANENILLDSTKVTLFKCQLLGLHKNAQDCSLCMAKHQKYGCTWCENQCAHSSQCQIVKVTSTCPKPEIFSVTPNAGPLEGGTKVFLDGINLRMPRRQSTKVKIGGKVCRIVRTSAESSISCLVPPTSKLMNASIEVENDRGSSRAKFLYHYTDFQALSVRPRQSPASGGIELTVIGVNLNIGSERKVFLDGIVCNNVQVINANRISCVVNGSGRPKTTTALGVKIDSAMRSTPFSFNFLPDPIIKSVKPLSSYMSGGRLISIHGEHFSALQQCQLIVYINENLTAKSNCTIISDSLMECLSPTVRNFGLNAKNQPMSFDIGLESGYIKDLLYLKQSFPMVESTLNYISDPSYFNLSQGYTISDEDALVIEGDGLSLASDVSDVNVRIGKSLCNVTSITITQLLCLPPKERPIGEDGGPPELVVSVGEKLMYNLGYVQFAADQRDEFSSEIIGAMSAVTAIVVFLVIVVLIVLKHKSSEDERESKRIQIQMDILEHNVRSECKQAFAELQTDMTDLSLELETSGIPIFPRKAFLMKIFFPGIENHPVLMTQYDSQHWNGHNDVQSSVGLSIRQFENLLHDKTFLSVLIDTLERQPTFGVRDKINFASLLSVFLCTKMEYFSEVLKYLLNQLVIRSQSRNPELLLRRTETILEKLLSNWLAVCLYDYVKDDIGPPLFFLCKAIKYQVQKGPVDAVTHESKYSLSDDGLLLGPSGDYSPISCLVLQRELEEAYETKVLDCDSISQVKSKILDSVYKNTPYSMRPGVDEIDLEWQCGQDAHVVLQDTDLTTETCGEYKKINTLKHYGLKNKALMSLVPKQFRKVDSPSKSDSKLYHLQSPENNNSQSNGVAGKPSKTIPEVYLTRLLATKGTLKKFVDDFMYSITRIPGRLPCSIKWLFDVFDDIVYNNQMENASNVLRSLKTNSVPLRFWLNLLKNPDLVYDVDRPVTVDNNLSVIAQILMSSCSGVDPSSNLTKDAPPHKLLFAKEIGDYRSRIDDFFSEIQALPSISDYDFDCHMTLLSRKHHELFNEQAALQELLLYLKSHMVELNQALSASQQSKEHQYETTMNVVYSH